MGKGQRAKFSKYLTQCNGKLFALGIRTHNEASAIEDCSFRIKFPSEMSHHQNVRPWQMLLISFRWKTAEISSHRNEPFYLAAFSRFACRLMKID